MLFNTTNDEITVTTRWDTPDTYYVFIKTRHDFDMVGGFPDRSDAEELYKLMVKYGGDSVTYDRSYENVHTGERVHALQILREFDRLKTNNPDAVGTMSPADYVGAWFTKNRGLYTPVWY